MGHHLPTDVVNGQHDHAGLHSDVNKAVNHLVEHLDREVAASPLRLDDDGLTPYFVPGLIGEDSPIGLDEDGTPYFTIGEVA